MVSNNIDYNKYFRFIFKLVNSKRLIKKNHIGKFIDDRLISLKDIEIKKTKIDFSIIEINLENNYILLIEDLPVNHLLSESILIGDKTGLLSFNFLENSNFDSSKKYLTSKSIMDLFKKDINFKSIKKENPWDFNNINFSKNFKDIEIISIFKDFANEVAGVNLNKIHIIDSDKIENFLPNTKKHHIDISRNLKIPLIDSIQGNFIKDSSINILDINSQNNILNPFYKFEKIIDWEFDKISQRRIFNKRIFKIYFKIDKKNLISTLKNKEKNFNLEIFEKNFKNLNIIELSSENSKFPLLLFESKSGFFKIKDLNEFKLLSGVEFKLETNFLENVFLQKLNGGRVFYINKFLNKKIINFLNYNSDIDKDQTIINYKNELDLILDFEINNFNSKNKILFNENISEENLKEIKIYIKKLIEKIILISIKNNKLPSSKIPEEILEKYFSSKYNILNELFENYKSNLNKKELLIKVKFEIRELFLVLKQIRVDFSDLYFLSEIVLVLIQILKVYNLNSGNYLSDLFFSYFKTFEIKFKKSRIDINLTRIIEGIFLANKLKKQKRNISIFIDIENSELYNKLINKRIKILNSEPEFQEYRKPNISKISNVFKYNKDEIIKQLSSSNSNIIEINNKKREISDEFIIYSKNYKYYKLIYDNSSIKVLEKIN